MQVQVVKKDGTVAPPVHNVQAIHEREDGGFELAMEFTVAPRVVHGANKLLVSIDGE